VAAAIINGMTAAYALSENMASYQRRQKAMLNRNGERSEVASRKRRRMLRLAEKQRIDKKAG